MKITDHIFVALAIFCTSFVKFSVSTGRIIVDIYYENNCPYSKKFIREQLEPNYEEIKDFIVLHFYPFGHSESVINADGSITFTCQHGPNECEGNMFQTCALNNAKTQDERVAIVFCAMTTVSTIQECISSLQLDGDAIEECMNGPEGIKLQLEYEILSEKPVSELGGVPAIVFNKTIDKEKETQALDDFRSVIFAMKSN
ncbi:CLUMA_CG017068, isoform A [Clunio marinus]|uniref:CLUMA_CG017068, isoform A n=1 Tax=Clunio marinus TaxID=568069 RepID=A0A1J1IUK9_9DIPT|nr:CLUMA_CG017068, isoform A [Clunio marinus]